MAKMLEKKVAAPEDSGESDVEAAEGPLACKESGHTFFLFFLSLRSDLLFRRVFSKERHLFCDSSSPRQVRLFAFISSIPEI